MMTAIRLETQLNRICTGLKHHVSMRVARACAMRLGNTRALWQGWAHRANCALAARQPALELGSEGRASEHGLDLRLGAFLRIGIGAAHDLSAERVHWNR